jgi:hypothetical protein
MKGLKLYLLLYALFGTITVGIAQRAPKLDQPQPVVPESIETTTAKATTGNKPYVPKLPLSKKSAQVKSNPSITQTQTNPVSPPPAAPIANPPPAPDQPTYGNVLAPVEPPPAPPKIEETPPKEEQPKVGRDMPQIGITIKPAPKEKEREKPEKDHKKHGSDRE